MNRFKMILETAGWQDVENYLLEKVKDGCGIDKVKTDKRYEDVAIEVMALQKAQRILKNALTGLKRMANEIKDEDEGYV